MVRKPRSSPGSKKAGKPAGVRTSADFKADLDKPDPSPLDFINRRMAEEDEGSNGS
jgi:hypothetical protein